MLGRLKAIIFVLIGGWTLIVGIFLGSSEITRSLLTGVWRFSPFVEEARFRTIVAHPPIITRVFEAMFGLPAAFVYVLGGALLLRSGILQLFARISKFRYLSPLPSRLAPLAGDDTHC